MEFINLKAQHEYLKDEINKKIETVLESGKFILSDMVEEFEEKIADYVNMKYAIGCANGTEALQLIFMAYGIGAGDAIFCPDMTFIASVEPAVMLGAYPVFCDIDLKTFNIDISSLEDKISETIRSGNYTPKAIVGVDFLGNPAAFEEMKKISDKYGLLLIEDAAQGMGAIYRDKKCCSLGDISATSFFPTKPLGCYGDGGAVFTNDEAVCNKIKSLRVHGKGKTKYDNVQIGLNSRLDAIQAAVLLVKIEVLEEELVKRQDIAGYYDRELEGVVKTPFIENGNRSSYAQYVVLAKNDTEKKRLVTALSNEDIPTLYYYPNPMHALPVFRKYGYLDKDYQNTFEYCNRAFAIPFSPYITIEEQKKIIEVIKRNVEN